MVREWIRKTEQAGWRVASVKGKRITIRCGCIGCPASRNYLIDGLDAVPAPCDLPHKNGHAKEVFDTYEKLVAELRRHRVQIGLDQQDLSDVMGVADGYIGKLESFAKTASPVTLMLWAQSLGLSITTTPAAMPKATAKAIQDRASSPYAVNQARFKHD